MDSVILSTIFRLVKFKSIKTGWNADGSSRPTHSYRKQLLIFYAHWILFIILSFKHVDQFDLHLPTCFLNSELFCNILVVRTGIENRTTKKIAYSGNQFPVGLGEVLGICGNEFYVVHQGGQEMTHLSRSN